MNTPQNREPRRPADYRPTFLALAAGVVVSLILFGLMSGVEPASRWQAWLVLSASLLLTSILGLYLYATARNTAQLKHSQSALREALEETERQMDQIVSLASLNRETTETLKASEARFRSVVCSARDAIITTDQHGAIVGWNEAAFHTFGYNIEEILGQPLERLLPDAPEKARVPRSHGENGFTPINPKPVEAQGLRKDGQRVELELSWAGWQTGKQGFYTAIIRDVTARKQAEAEREQLIAQLQQALSEVKTLRGLIPICSACNKIRDDQGAWNNIEDFIEARSHAQFSHSMCPECFRSHYPEMADHLLPRHTK